MIWLAAILGVILVMAIAFFAVGRVSAELEGTVAPALLEIDDAVHAVADALPYEVSAVVSHEDVDQVIRWILDSFSALGLSSEFGEELGGPWVVEDRAVADEISSTEYAIARSIDDEADIDAVHVAVIVDSFLGYLRDIGAVGDEVL